MAKLVNALGPYEFDFAGTETELVLDLAKAPFNVSFNGNLPSSASATVQGATVSSTTIVGTIVTINLSSVTAGLYNVYPTLRW